MLTSDNKDSKELPAFDEQVINFKREDFIALEKDKLSNKKRTRKEFELSHEEEKKQLSQDVLVS